MRILDKTGRTAYNRETSNTGQFMDSIAGGERQKHAGGSAPQKRNNF